MKSNPLDAPLFKIADDYADIVPSGAVCYPLGLNVLSYLTVTNWGLKALILVRPDFDFGKALPGLGDCFSQTIDGLKPLNESARELLKRIL
jgi:hypothetical protein